MVIGDNKRLPSERKSLLFFLFFLTMTLSNTMATGCAYLFFYLSQSLPLLGFSGAFVMLALNISRLTLLCGLFFLRLYSDRFSKHTLSFILGSLSFLSFLCLSSSHGWVWILLGSLIFGLSGSGPVVLASMMIQSTPPSKRLRYYGIFAASYSLSSLIASIFAQQMVIYIGRASATHFSTWGMVWPFADLQGNPNAILLPGLLLSGLWVSLVGFGRWLQKHLQYYAKHDESDPHSLVRPSWRAYRSFMGWALLLGILWVCIMDIIPGYTAHYQISGGATGFFAGFGISAVVGRLGILPKLSPSGRPRVFFGGGFLYLLSLSALWFLPWVRSPLLSIFAGICLGLAHGVLHTLVNILFVEQTPAFSGSATFAYMFLFNLGALVSLSTTLWIDFVGYRGIFLILAIFLVICLILSAKWIPRKILEGLPTSNMDS